MARSDSDPVLHRDSTHAADLEDPSFLRMVAALGEVGRRRSRARTIGYVIAAGLGLLALQLANIVVGMIACGLAGGVAVFVAGELTERYIDEAADRHGVQRKELAASLTDVGPQANPMD